jgi:Cdc6-like AAA superfamily ATPase
LEFFWANDVTKPTYGALRPWCRLLAMVLLSASMAASAATVSSADTSAPNAAKVTGVLATGGSDQLLHEIEDLRALLEGQLPQFISLPSLFEIDLSDEVAVERRVATLSARLSAPAGEGTEVLGSTELRDLRMARDRLRLAFLQLPVARRSTLIAQDRLHRESVALAAEQRDATDALAASEIARDNALATGSQASAGLEQAVAAQEARLLSHLSELAALRQSWATADHHRVTQIHALLTRYAPVSAQRWLSPEDADALYAGIGRDLKDLRTQAKQALEALNSPSDIQPIPAAQGSEAIAVSDRAAVLKRVRQLQEQVQQEHNDLRQREIDRRYLAASEIMSALDALQQGSIALLILQSPERQAAVTGFSFNVVDRVLGEVAHLRLMAWWYVVKRTHDANAVATVRGAIATARNIEWQLLGLAMVAAATAYARYRLPKWLGRLRAWVSTRQLARPITIRLDRSIQMLSVVSGELLILLAVYLAFDHMLVGFLGVTEIATVRALAYLFALYALALGLLHRVLLVAVSRYRVVGSALNHKILRSLRHVARLVLTLNCFLVIAQALLGRGNLYGIVQSAALLAAVWLAWRLIGDWQTDVTTAYLRFSPQGKLADTVRASEGGRWGLLIAAFAFVFVAARGIWTWLSDIALGFELTHKALAYIFRRQLERHAKTQNETPTVSELPAEVQLALSEEPVAAAMGVDLYPGLDGILDKAKGMSRGNMAALVAITGDPGTGKTSWLLALHQRLNGVLPSKVYTFENRISSPQALTLLLSELLGIEPTSDVRLLIERTRQGEPQVLLLDLCQNMMLRAVGGLQCYEVFLQIAHGTLGKVLWVVAFARQPFEYLNRMRPNQDVYDKTIALEPWTDDQISRLIESRMETAGYEVDYDHLLLKSVPVLPSPAAIMATPDMAVERNADRYNRLIWDYSNGNPRVALHFFRLSLQWTGGKQVKVRLFPMPPITVLEELESGTGFVLACLVRHENLTVDEAAESLRFSHDACARAMQLLLRLGVLSCTPNGRFRVTCHWSGVVMRFLQRKKLHAI